MTVMVMMKINSLLLLSLFLFEIKKKTSVRRPRTRSKGERRIPAGVRRVLTDVRTAVQTSHCSKNGAPDFSRVTSPKDVTFVTRSTLARSSRGFAAVVVAPPCANRKRSSRSELQKPTKRNETKRDRYPHSVREPVRRSKDLLLVHVLFFLHLCFLVRTLGLLPHYSVYRQIHTFTSTHSQHRA